MQDLTYAARTLLKAPGFAAVAVLTLALGIGANTAIFTVVNALVLRPLPYPEAGRLVMVWQDYRARGGPEDEWATPGTFVDWRDEPGLFRGVAAMSGWRPTLTGGAEPEALPGEQVTHAYFSVLGITPALGRSFAPEDDVPNAPSVAVIGHGLWQRRFGGSPAAVGQLITLSGVAHEIIGVLPPGARPILSARAEIWRPLRMNLTTPSRGSIFLRVVARLPDGADQERAQAAISALAARQRAAHPRFNDKVDFRIQPLHDRVVGDIRPGLLALLGAVAFVLLIACANIANLLMARGSARGRELAVRVALGAGRWRVVRQLMTESLLLAVLGGLAGLLVGAWAVEGLVAMAPADAPRLGEVGLDLTVFAFAALLTLLTGLLFGLAPALQHARVDVTHALKDGARGSSGSGGRFLRRALITAEVALALVLLAGGVLLMQTFVRLQSADLGFRTDVLVGSVSPSRATYDSREKLRAFYDQLLERAQAIPGVERAALTSILPLNPGDNDSSFSIEGRPAPASDSETPVTWYREVSAGYFDTIGMRVVRGRGFADREPAPSVVVNETFARKYYPGEDPVGRRLRFGGAANPWFTILGVVGDVKMRGAREDTRVEAFIPYWQLTEGGMNVVLAGANPAQFTGALRQAVSSIDRNVPVVGASTMSAIVGESIGQPRFFAVLAGSFAGLALLLAAIGIYGVMSYAVSQRTTEIGVRMALGATAPEVFRLVIGDGLRLAALGVAIGIGGALLVGRWLTSLLFGITPGDPATLLMTAGLLLAVAFVASFIPAWRATRVDPMVALRAD